MTATRATAAKEIPRVRAGAAVIAVGDGIAPPLGSIACEEACQDGADEPASEAEDEAEEDADWETGTELTAGETSGFSRTGAVAVRLRMASKIVAVLSPRNGNCPVAIS